MSGFCHPERAAVETYTNPFTGVVSPPTQPINLTSFGNAVYFDASPQSDPSIILSLYKSDGATTSLVQRGVNFAQSFAVSNGTFYFNAASGPNTALYRYDGTTVSLAANIHPNGQMQPTFVTAFNGGVVFTADDGVHNREPWFWNGSAATLIADIASGAISSNPSFYTAVGNKVYFAADDGVHGRELWSWDGSTTSMVVDLAPGYPGGANPVWLKNYQGHLYFSATDGTLKADGQTPVFGLWRWDGQTATQVANIGGSVLSELKVAGDKLYFAANDGAYGSELWIWDGSKAAIVADINSGSAGFNPHNLTEVGGILYFAADDGIHGHEPWRLSEGVASMLGNVAPGSASSMAYTGMLGMIAGFDSDIAGTAGNDVLNSSSGSEAFNGNAGIDTVVYGGNRAGFTITKTAAGYSVSDTADVEGTDALHREGEPAGTAHWTDVLDTGACRAQVLTGFSESAENQPR